MVVSFFFFSLDRKKLIEVNFLKMKFALFFLVVVFMSVSCNTSHSSQPPSPRPVCAVLGDHGYNCATDNPSWLTQSGMGSIQLSVVSNNAKQFSQIVEYRPDNFQGPAVTTQNGTAKSNGHKLSGTADIYFDVPMSDGYTIQIRYMEYGSESPNESYNLASSCSNPSTSNCFRWWKQVSVGSGDFPRCTSGVSYIVNLMDPNGFIASCVW